LFLAGLVLWAISIVCHFGFGWQNANNHGMVSFVALSAGWLLMGIATQVSSAFDERAARRSNRW
jgi:hypothetical protein